MLILEPKLCPQTPLVVQLQWSKSSFRHSLPKQADGALGEPSDKSDFSLLVWDSFSQEIPDLLFIFYGQKSLIYLKCSDFLPKKEEMCYFFIEKREKQNKRIKKS